MVNIRILLALAISACPLFVVPAAAQIGGNNPLTCNTIVGSTPTLRTEGYTERVGEIVLMCTGGTLLQAGSQTPAVNIQVFLNTAVTSRVYSNGASEALLLIDEPGSGLVGTSNTQLACPTPTVAFPSSGLTPSVRSPDNSSPGSSYTVTSCAAPQRTVVLRFSESFGTAFLTRSSAAFVDGETSPAPAIQNVPGTVYNGESGFYNPALTAPTVDFTTVGLANSGTRVRAQFNNIAAGSRVWVSLRNTIFVGGNPTPASTGTVARLVTNETAGFAPQAASTTLENVPVSELAVTNGSASAVWEVLGTNPNALEDLDFVVWVQAGIVAGAASLNPSFAPAPPAFSAAAAGTASATLPIPRFIADPNAALSLFTSVACAAVTTTTTLSTSANTGPSGTPITLTANVTAAAGTPTGTVTFLDGNVPLVTVPVVNGVATAAVTLPPGAHTLMAVFSGGSSAFASSTSGPASVTVQSSTRAASSISLASSLSPSVIGQAVVFTASVTAGGATPTGSVRFVDGGTTLATVPLIAGQASFSVTFTTAGTHDIFAFYSGDSAVADSSTRFGQVVNRVTPALTLSSSATASQLTLTAQLTAPPAGAPAATGQVQFFDGAASLGSAPIVNGVASLTAALTAGSHQLSATYSGDLNWFSTRSQVLAVTVTPPALSLTGSALANGQVGVSYSGSVSASAGTPPFTYAGSGLPDGLSLSGSGAISGTPTTDGQFSFAVTATDSTGAKATATFSITIVPAKLAVTTSTLPDGVVLTAYSASLAASGGVRPYTWTVAGLPGGLNASAAGAISGTPNATGRFNVTATVKDSAGVTASASVALVVTAGSPVITTASLPNGTVGTPYAASLIATGGQAPLTWSAVGMPAGLSISAAGVISGTPVAPGTSAITVTVRDSAGASPFGAQFTIVIALPATPPLNFAGLTATSSPLQQPRLTVALGAPYPVDVVVTLTLTFAPDTGADDPTIVFSSGGRTARITVPAGSLNGASDVGVQTGSVAGLITITAQLQASGLDVTGSPAPRSTIRIAPAAPVITTATAARTATGFTITAIGLVTNREVTQAIFTLNPAAGANLQTTSLTVAVDAIFSGYLLSPASTLTGTMFTYIQPFTVNGSSQAIASVTITLVNRVGSSSTTTVNLN